MDGRNDRVLVHLKCTNGITRVVDFRTVEEVEFKVDHISVLLPSGEIKVRLEEEKKIIEAAERTGVFGL